PVTKLQTGITSAHSKTRPRELFPLGRITRQSEYAKLRREVIAHRRGGYHWPPAADDAIVAVTPLLKFAGPSSGTLIRQPHALPPVTSHQSPVTSSYCGGRCPCPCPPPAGGCAA